MPSISRLHHGVRFIDDEEYPEETISKPVSPRSPSTDSEEYEVPVPHGYPTQVMHTLVSGSLSVPTPRIAILDVAPILRPYGRTLAAVDAVTPAQPATTPPLPTLQLVLPLPFGTTIIPAANHPHVTVHDVWAALSRFWHTPATRDELNMLSESDRNQVKAAYHQRVPMPSADGLRRQDFARGAVMVGVEPIAEGTIALVLGNAP
ncbi:hypothetical protein PENSPDRAFT_658943 [Peniophora sp. CONT]|nr:hypothetical protein PENSPDRAFT_658943 [Peniophora sp. CONT]